MQDLVCCSDLPQIVGRLTREPGSPGERAQRVHDRFHVAACPHCYGVTRAFHGGERPFCGRLAFLPLALIKQGEVTPRRLLGDTLEALREQLDTALEGFDAEDAADLLEHVGACAMCSRWESTVRRGWQPAPKIESTVAEPAELPEGVVDVREPGGGKPRPYEEEAGSRPEVGARFGGYRLETLIARGGMGEVFAAEDTEAGERIALKVLRGDQGPQALERFRLEAQAASRLVHPNIVRTRQVGAVGERTFMTMDLVEGPTLKERIREGALASREAARITEKLARAVYYAHSQAVLHRDIKPQNVLLGEGDEPLLTDFGLVKELGEEETRGLTLSGQVLGTPAYMPPEQARGDVDQVDRRSDVYSLGASLYEMLSGAPPFEGSAGDVLLQILRDTPPEPSQRKAGVDPRLETICLRCLEKDPADRYGSAQDLAEDLARFLADQPIRARRIGWLGRLWRRVRRRPGGFFALLLGSLAVSVALAIATQQALSAQALAEREAARAQRAESIAAVRGHLERGYGLLSFERPAEALDSFAQAEALARVQPADGEDRATLDALHDSAVLGAREATARVGATRTLSAGAEWVTFAGPHLIAGRSQVRAFEMPSGEALALRLPGKGGAAAGVASPDGSRIYELRATPPGSLVRCLDAQTGAVLWSETREGGSLQAPGALSASPDGSLLAWARDDVVELIDASTGASRRLLASAERPHARYANPAFCVAFSPDGAELASAYPDGTVSFWDVRTGAHLRWLHPYRSSVRLVRYTPAGTFTRDVGLITASHEGRVDVFDLERIDWSKAGEVEALERRHSFMVQAGTLPYALSLSSDGSLLAVGFDTGGAYVWHASGRLVRKVRADLTSRVHDLAFAPDARTLVLATGDETELVSIGDVQIHARSGPLALAGARIAWTEGAWTGTVSLEVHDLQRGAPVWRGPMEGIVRGVALSPDGARVAISRSPRGVEKRGVLQTWTLDGSADSATAAHPTTRTLRFEGDALLAGSGTGGYTISYGPGDLTRFAEDLTPAGALRWHAGGVTGVARSGELLATASLDGTVALWRDGADAPHRVLDVIDGRSLIPTPPAAGVDDAQARLEQWSRVVGRPRPHPKQEAHRGVARCAFSPDGSLLAIACADTRVHLYDVRADRFLPQSRLEGHERPLLFCGFLPGGKILVTASKTGVVRLWDLRARRVLRTLRAEAVLSDCVLDGHTLAAASQEEGLVWVWDLSTPEYAPR